MTRIYLQAFGKYRCAICGNDCIHHVLPTPKICRECTAEEAIKHYIIKE